MKKWFITILFVALIFVTGCTQVTNPPPQPDDPIRQDIPAQNDDPVQPDDPTTQKPTQPADLDYDLGTIPANITNGRGFYAMADGFVYISRWGSDVILEYDTVSGTCVPIHIPQRENNKINAQQLSFGYRFYDSLFLLKDNIGFVERSSEQFQYEDERGKLQWRSRQNTTFSILSLDGQSCTPIPELGNYVFKVVPMKKLNTDEKWKSSSADNPLAGLLLYCIIGYDTFPETAAQLAEQGILLEEPMDPNERNRYIIPSFVCLDGDTREVTTLTQDFIEVFVDEQYIYVLRQNGSDTEYLLYRSERDEINFQKLDLGGEISNFITPYDGGVYFARAGSWSVCYYKDGEITALPIVAADFIRCDDKIVYYASHWQEPSQTNPVRCYDLNTGEDQELCANVAYDTFCVIGNRYVACRQETNAYEADILVDLETGNQTELYRVER